MWTYLENYFNLKKSFVFYGSYHREWRNQLTHVIFVPIIFTTTLGFLSKVRITDKVNLSHPFACFYALSFIVMEPIAGLLYAPVIAGMQYIAQNVCAENVGASTAMYLVGWVSQIIAHKVFERRAPAFTEDPPQAFHAAVFFVWLEVLYALGYRKQEHETLKSLVAERVKKMEAAEAAHKAAPA